MEIVDIKLHKRTLDHILYSLTQGALTKMEFPLKYDNKQYNVKAYLVGKLIRIDIQEV